MIGVFWVQAVDVRPQLSELTEADKEWRARWRSGNPVK
jgi:hypothetical protein